MDQTSHKSTVLNLALSVFFVLISVLSSISALRASEVLIPNYFDARERLSIADTSNINRIRFLTTVDFPPFSFLDQTGRLSGFHVDLAREICSQLNIIDRCQIQALEWKDLDSALKDRKGDALIAGVSISEQTRSKYNFTRTYLELPARFVTQSDKSLRIEDIKINPDLKIGVLKGTAHEAMLRSWYPHLKPILMEDRDAFFNSIKSGNVDAAFGDGLQISFWLAGEGSSACCKFFGGPHLSRDFLGQGFAIAARKTDQDLVDTLNYGLSLISKSGRFAELYLKYFPNGIY